MLLSFQSVYVAADYKNKIRHDSWQHKLILIVKLINNFISKKENLHNTIEQKNKRFNGEVYQIHHSTQEDAVTDTNNSLEWWYLSVSPAP